MMTARSSGTSDASNPIQGDRAPGQSAGGSSGAHAPPRSRLLVYNALAIAQTGLALAFQLVVARRFGVSESTDVYFASLTLLTVLTGLVGLFSETFLQHYTALAVERPADAAGFYDAVLGLSIAVSAALYLAILGALPFLAGAIAPGFTFHQRQALVGFFAIHGLSLVAARVTLTGSAAANAHMRFFVPYAVSCGVQVLNLCGLLAFGDRGLTGLAVVLVASSAIGAIVQVGYVRRLVGSSGVPRVWHPEIPSLWRSSAPMRAGHQLWTFKDLLTTHAASNLGPGALSTFNYAWRLISIVFSVTSSPALQIHQSQAARMVALRNGHEIPKARARVLASNLVLFSGGVLAAVVCLPSLLPVVFGERASARTLRAVYVMFLALIPVHLVMSFELPLVQTVIAFRKGGRILRAGAIYLVVYALLLSLLPGRLGLFVLPLALLLADGLTLAVYLRTAARLCSTGG